MVCVYYPPPPLIHTDIVMFVFGHLSEGCERSASSCFFFFFLNSNYFFFLNNMYLWPLQRRRRFCTKRSSSNFVFYSLELFLIKKKKVSLGMTVMVEVLGQRSGQSPTLNRWLTLPTLLFLLIFVFLTLFFAHYVLHLSPVNSSVVFRQKCSDFAPNMGRLTLPSVLATSRIRNVVARCVFVCVCV